MDAPYPTPQESAWRPVQTLMRVSVVRNGSVPHAHMRNSFKKFLDAFFKLVHKVRIIMFRQATQQSLRARGQRSSLHTKTCALAMPTEWVCSVEGSRPIIGNLRSCDFTYEEERARDD
jgi:hypothetical protein